MKYVSTIAVLLLLTGCLTRGMRTAPPEPLPLEQQQALAGIMAYQFGESREPLTAVENLVQDEMKSRDGGHALAAHLSHLLTITTTKDCKQFVCRQLWLIGNEDNVPDIAPLLLDPATSDMARYALEGIPGRDVDDALMDALDKTSGTTKIGIINSLGARESNRAVSRLRQLSRSGDAAVAEAAKHALDRIDS